MKSPTKSLATRRARFMRAETGVEIAGKAPVKLLEWTRLAVTWDQTKAVFYVNRLANATSHMP